MTTSNTHRGSAAGKGIGATVTAAVAAFGLVMSSTLVAIVAAGALQWLPALPPMLDPAGPLLVLGAGMALAGRVAVDVAGPSGVRAAAGAAVLVAALGMVLSRASEAHGDGVEPPWVALAATCVFVVVGGSAWLVQRHNASRRTGDGSRGLVLAASKGSTQASVAQQLQDLPGETTGLRDVSDLRLPLQHQRAHADEAQLPGQRQAGAHDDHVNVRHSRRKPTTP